MNKTAISAAASLAGLLLTSPVPAADQPGAAPADAAQAAGIVKEFFGTLSGELQTAIKEGGPVNAITVCRERAPAIARSLSEKTGWEVGRTALKLRNADLNAPDAWERQVLESFLARQAKGEDLKTMTQAEVVESGGARQFRFMKAIPTGDLCLACHGEDLAPELAAAIDKAYPADQAKGFKLGELRGAFTLSKGL